MKKTLPVRRINHSTLTDQTVQALQEAIQRGRFQPGSQLPPEMELLQMLGISRTTLREALRILEEQRLIRKRRGLGTFVMERAIIKDMSLNFGITEMISQAGYTPGTRDFQIRQERVGKSIADKLQIPDDSTVLVVERVRTANNVAVVWTRDIMPLEVLNGWMPSKEQLWERSLYDCLHEYANVRIHSGMASFTPVQANAEIAARLQIPRSTLLLLIDQVDQDDDQRAVLYSAEYHLTDKFKFIIHRKGPAF